MILATSNEPNVSQAQKQRKPWGSLKHKSTHHSQQAAAQTKGQLLSDQQQQMKQSKLSKDSKDFKRMSQLELITTGGGVGGGGGVRKGSVPTSPRELLSFSSKDSRNASLTDPVEPSVSGSGREFRNVSIASVSEHSSSSPGMVKESRTMSVSDGLDSKKSSQARTSEPTVGSKWNVSSTSLWQYPLDLVVTNVAELCQLERFIACKV